VAGRDGQLICLTFASGPNAISNAKFYSRSRDGVIRVYDESAIVMPSLFAGTNRTTEQRFTRRTRQKFTLLWRWLPDDRAIPFHAVLSGYLRAFLF
jgi:hypothetical protein